MNIPEISTNGILMMHSGIRGALAVDDSLPVGKEKIYGVREFKDWRVQADQFEAELDKRHVRYQKIDW